jgi:cobalt-zinc-cadmium efflux system outer membrane protein
MKSSIFGKRFAGVVTLILLSSAALVYGQIVASPVAIDADADVAKYLDQHGGLSVDQAVARAIDQNAELAAMRKEVQAAEALIRQAALRANPSLEASGTRQLGGADNSLMVQGSLPLELGGRRAARIKVAQAELEIRRQAYKERERQVAFEVRSKFGEGLAAIQKLRFAEEMLDMAVQNRDLVAAQVAEGRRPPLEESMESVELNRIRASRESSEGTVEVRLLELRNLIGAAPEEPLRLRGDFTTLLEPPLPIQAEATQRALQGRPDLAGARALEQLAAARGQQARAEGRTDAEVMVGYQRMRSGFPLLGVQESTGSLLPIEDRFHFFTFGVRLELPVRNRNQGMIAAARLEEDAARSRREFGELTIRREVASAFARYQRARRSMEIYRGGVRDQSAVNLDVVRQTFELGEKTLLDYIAEHHRFLEVENGFIDLSLESYLALLEILRASNDPKLTNK